MSIPTDGEADHRERAVLREWEYLQQSLLTFALATSSSPAANRRLLIEDQIVHSTRGCARLWWEPYTNSSAEKDSWLLEVRYQRIRYGTLELSTGYLVSSMQPH